MEMWRFVALIALVVTIGVAAVAFPPRDREASATFSAPHLGTSRLRLLCWDTGPEHCLAIPPGECATTHGVTLCAKPDATKGFSP